jgi:hypothetical protein
VTQQTQKSSLQLRQLFAQYVTITLEVDLRTIVLEARLVWSVQQEHTQHLMRQAVLCRQQLAAVSVTQVTFVITLEAGAQYKIIAEELHFIAQQEARLPQRSVPTITPSILMDPLEASLAIPTIASVNMHALLIAPALVAFYFPLWTRHPHAALLASTLK